MTMRKKALGEKVIKLLQQGYTPTEITQRMAVSYNYAWKLWKDMRDQAQAEVKAKAGEFIVVEGAKSAQEVDAILNERASTYGSFVDVAKVAQQLKHVAASHTIAVGVELSHDKIEALEMIFSKIARILNGNSDHVDSWVDIAGYAQLVADRLHGKIR